METASEAIFVVDQSGIFKYANSRTSELSGYTHAELLSMPIIELVYGEDRDMVSQRIRERLAGDTNLYAYQFRFVDKQGNVKWAQQNSVGIVWEGQPAGLCFVADISEIKRPRTPWKSNALFSDRLSMLSPTLSLFGIERGATYY